MDHITSGTLARHAILINAVTAENGSADIGARGLAGGTARACGQRR